MIKICNNSNYFCDEINLQLCTIHTEYIHTNAKIKKKHVFENARKTF